MSDVVTERCLSHINNRFKLVALASQRVHCLNAGAEPVIKCMRSKNTTIALNEIASNKLDYHILFNLIVHRCQKSIEATTSTIKKDLDDNIEEVNFIDNEELSNQEDDLNDDQGLLFEDDINIENELDS